MRKHMIALGMVMTLALAGCQKAPENSIVKNKDIDKMVDEAKEIGSDYVAPESMTISEERYRETITDEKLRVTVNIDAEVDIPKVKKMSIVRVKQKNITQELLDKVKRAVELNQELYDGRVLWAPTKKKLEKKIQYLKKLKAEQGEVDEFFKKKLEKVEKLYKTAPQDIVWSNFSEIKKIEKVQTLVNNFPDDELYQWEYSLNPKGEFYYGITDGKNGKYQSLCVQNNADRGNCLRYHSSKNVYGSVYVCGMDAGQTVGNTLDTNFGMWPADREMSAGDTSYADISAHHFYEVENEPTTITEESAKKKADQFLQNIGLKDYQCQKGGLYYEIPNDGEEEYEEDIEIGYRKIWYFRYLRYQDSVFVDNGSGSKHEEGWSGNQYVKRDWPGESIDICVNDEGIVTFNYNAPLEITETLVDKSKIKSFEEIKNIFQKMAARANASEVEGENIIIDINKVYLRYVRISEPDSYDSGLLVPVWDFVGSKTGTFEDPKNYQSSNTGTTSVLTINAIDGSVIDKGLGY